MERLEVDVITGEIKTIPLTREEIDTLLAQVVPQETPQPTQE